MEDVELFGDLDYGVVAQRLRAARQRTGLTQRQVAWRANMNPTHYTELERGTTPGMRVHTLYKLCQVLRVSADVLLGLTTREE